MKRLPGAPRRVGASTALAIGILTTSAGCGSAPSAVSAHSPGTRALSVLTFSDGQGWAAGPGIALHTADNGRTWQTEPLKASAPVAMVWASRQVGWVLSRPPGHRPTLWGTIDGGRQWHALTHRDLTALEFLSSRDGYGLTRQGTLVKTRDGGQRWTAVPTPVPIRSFTFRSMRTGWVGSASSWAIWRTTSGGRSWTPVPVPVASLAGQLVRGQAAPNRGWVGALLATRAPHSLWAVFDEVGWAGTPRPGVVARSVNERDWTVALAGDELTALQHSGAVYAALEQCPACGPHGSVSLWTSDDGGFHWAATPIPAAMRPLEANTLAVTEKHHLWIVGDRGIWVSTDLGRHWHEVLSIR
jgi:photosystem II stability/assembly factor-like uncharacterized protein